MEREMIERLAVDSAAGELNEDAEILFREYLAEHPQADNWAQKMLQVYEKTQSAIKTRTKGAGRSGEATIFDMNPLLRVRWFAVGRWAAVIILAAVIGVGLGRWSKSGYTGTGAERIVVFNGAAVEGQGNTIVDGESDFWRAKVAAALKPKPYSEHKTYMQGGSLREKYRQYVEEKRYE